MKVYILNLPYKRNIIRKYSCSYYANGFLYPPMELIRVASIIQKYSATPHDIFFTDAIAHQKNIKQCIAEIENIKPDIIITITSVDFINEEYSDICSIKKFSDSKLICIGYLPDLFPERFTSIDLILGKNFEEVFQKAFSDYGGSQPEEILEYLKFFKNQASLFDPDLLETIDFSFVDQKKYNEFQTQGKTAFTYFSFGCPFHCSFCIKTYNLNTVYFRKHENIFSELLSFNEQGIRNIRIMDDNIPLQKSFLYALRDFLQENNLKFKFYGLSRIDLLDEDTIILLKEIGFRRILIGLETINPVLQKEYNKNIRIDLKEIGNRIRLLNKQKIQTAVFILFNPVIENSKDVKTTLRFLKNLSVDYASMANIIPYPETDFFKKNESNIDFNLYPIFKSSLKQKDKAISKTDEYYFFISFYIFNKLRIFRTFFWFIKYPKQSFRIFINLFRWSNNNTIDRKDFF